MLLRAIVNITEFRAHIPNRMWHEPATVLQGRLYRELSEGKVQQGSVSLVLGAGNQVNLTLKGRYVLSTSP